MFVLRRLIEHRDQLIGHAWIELARTCALAQQIAGVARDLTAAILVLVAFGLVVVVVAFVLFFFVVVVAVIVVVVVVLFVEDLLLFLVLVLVVVLLLVLELLGARNGFHCALAEHLGDLVVRPLALVLDPGIELGQRD